MEVEKVAPSKAKGNVPKTKTAEERKLIPCKFFSTAAGCKKGAACNMLHSASASVVAVAPVAEKTQIVRDIVCSTLGEFFKKKTFCVSPKDEAVVSFYEGNQNVVSLATWNPVPHPLSHVSRDLAFNGVMASECKGLKQVSVLSVFGAGRDKKNTKLEGHASGGEKLKVEAGLSVDVVCGPNENYPGDAGKTEQRQEIPSGKMFDVVIAVDVYWDGRRGAFGPEAAHRYCALSRTRSMFFICRQFLGEAGCDDVEGYTGEVEGVWTKQLGMIQFSPDSSRFGYPGHWGMEWLYDKSTMGLSTTFIGTSGPYTIVKVALDSALVINVPVYNQPRPKGIIEYIENDRPGVYYCLVRAFGVPQMVSTVYPGSLENWTVGRNVWRVHLGLLAELQSVYELKVSNGHNLDMVRSTVCTRLLQIKSMEMVSKRFPGYLDEVVRDTADAILYGRKNLAAVRVYAHRTDTAGAEEMIVAARAPVFTVPSASKLKRAFIAGVLLMFVWKFAHIFGAWAIIGPYGESGLLIEDPWVVGYLIVAIFIVAGLAVNWLETKKRGIKGIFKNWEARHSRSELSEEGVVGYEVVPAGASVRSVNVQAMNCEIGLGEIKVVVGDFPKTVEEAFELLKTDETEKVSYVIAVTDGMLFQPDRSDVNALAACVQRLHVRVLPSQISAWAEVDKIIDLMYVEAWEMIPVSIEKCAEAMGGVKGLNLIQSWHDLLDGKISRHKKGVMVKWNETICLKFINGKWTIKPRAIVVLSNEHHSLFAPYARGLSDALHNLFDGRIFDNCKVYYASGYSGDKLDEVGRTLYEGLDFIAASGDDSIASFAEALRSAIGSEVAKFILPILEGDFSAMDQSEKKEAIEKHCRIMQIMSVPAWCIDFYAAVSMATYVVKGKYLRIRGSVGFQLSTGIDFTTVCNSLTTILFLLLARRLIRSDPESVAASLGLTLKLKRHSDPRNATFLKGWWQPDEMGVVRWCPLPSQVIKVGKLLREPRLFSPTKDMAEGVKIAAWAIAQSMPTIPEDYPVLGPFLAMLRRLGKRSDHAFSASEDGWYKPQTSGSVSRGAVLEVMCGRYGLQVEEVYDCEKLIREVDALPVFLAHHVFRVMSRIDYS